MNKKIGNFLVTNIGLELYYIVPSFVSLLVMSVTSNPMVEIPGDKSNFLVVGNPTVPPFMYDSTQWNLGQLPHAEKEAIQLQAY